MESQESRKTNCPKDKRYLELYIGLYQCEEIRQLRAIANVKMINIYVPHDRVPIVQRTKGIWNYFPVVVYI
jgi:hypothetical protein